MWTSMNTKKIPSAKHGNIWFRDCIVNSGEDIAIDVNRTSILTQIYTWLSWWYYQMPFVSGIELYNSFSEPCSSRKTTQINHNHLVNELSVGNKHSNNLFLYKWRLVTVLPLPVPPLHLFDSVAPQMYMLQKFDFMHIYLFYPNIRLLGKLLPSTHRKNNITLCKRQIKIQH